MTEITVKKYVVIVAGGIGTRMNSTIPKQFMKLNGKPVLMHTITKFFDCGLNPEIIIALPPSQSENWQQLCTEHKFTTPVKITEGGETRYDSVKKALQLIVEPGLVAIHDAVRPLVNTKTILAAFRDAEMYGNAVPAVPLNDSIRKIESGKSMAVDRSRYCVIQTPQCFRTEKLKKAYQKEYKTTFTDDASIVEASGEQIHLIDGTPENIKITNPQDLIVAEAIIKLAAQIPLPIK
ncbi:MAG: 2-C-methyl-D-erythritol 4-phosphate cytidylyltransferase [Bacteroidia bacterium]|nr:2-C-methyl-D-erythritol 4-phosphate cytidylyltransferase [Bacteroidia bacterium]